MDAFKERIEGLSTEELLAAIKNRKDFQDAFIQEAIIELNKRGVSTKVHSAITLAEKLEKERLKKNFKQDIRKTKSRKESIVLWIKVFLLILIEIVFFNLIMKQASNIHEEQRAIRGFIGTNALIFAGWIYNVFRVKRDNDGNTEVDETGYTYECIHCGFIDKIDFDYCPKCKKNDDGFIQG